MDFKRLLIHSDTKTSLQSLQVDGDSSNSHRNIDDSGSHDRSQCESSSLDAEIASTARMRSLSLPGVRNIFRNDCIESARPTKRPLMDPTAVPLAPGTSGMVGSANRPPLITHSRVPPHSSPRMVRTSRARSYTMPGTSPTTRGPPKMSINLPSFKSVVTGEYKRVMSPWLRDILQTKNGRNMDTATVHSRRASWTYTSPNPPHIYTTFNTPAQYRSHPPYLPAALADTASMRPNASTPRLIGPNAGTNVIAGSKCNSSITAAVILARAGAAQPNDTAVSSSLSTTVPSSSGQLPHPTISRSSPIVKSSAMALGATHALPPQQKLALFGDNLGPPPTKMTTIHELKSTRAKGMRQYRSEVDMVKPTRQPDGYPLIPTLGQLKYNVGADPRVDYNYPLIYQHYMFIKKNYVERNLPIYPPDCSFGVKKRWQRLINVGLRLDTLMRPPNQPGVRRTFKEAVNLLVREQVEADLDLGRYADILPKINRMFTGGDSKE